MGLNLSSLSIMNINIKLGMQFDILNELLTSTVLDLFTNSESVTYESKMKVKELQGLIKKQTVQRGSSVDSHNVSEASESSIRESRNVPLRKCKSVDEWMKVQAPKRLAESMLKLGLNESLIKSRQELDSFVDSMTPERLGNEKKKVKNELRYYDNDFNQLFNRAPSHDEKEPFRPLYVYYKKLKEYITKKGGNQLSQEAIEMNIRNIKTERRQLREKIEKYQDEFEKINNRKIRYARDIATIETQYKRYKDLKAELLRYEEMLNK